MRTINIDDSRSDVFYRYKMPAVSVKIEGRGNGIKTVLPNIDDIAKSLMRDPRHITKYLSYEMGTLSSIDEKNAKYIINGAHDKERVQIYIYHFVNDFVLCPECRNPETVLFVSPSKKQVCQQCKACGREGYVKSTNKILKSLLKELPSKEEAGKKDEDDHGFSDGFEDFEQSGYVFGK